ncbi:hypothetical protein CTAYLR_007125 [Chrysophaeum taylorii]|uniref:Uncharacterized protein n=1 Tax=Chrysophaeum taylorii TaxID=2483200 RepID=A0AAD7U8W9_9STRA|nr:hypothetical protein CTAYLR_007125 [Chrysophaeum taylorii]
MMDEARPLRQTRRDGLKLMAGLVALFLSGAAVRHRSRNDPTTTTPTLRRRYSRDEDAAWSAFKKQFARSYASVDEEEERRSYFHQRMRELDALNEKNGEPVFGINRWADRNPGTHAYARGREGMGYVPDEYKVLDLDAWKAQRRTLLGANFSNGVVDWRRVNGVLTPVKNQGQCGSCWAFSTAEQIESQLVLAGAATVDLSAQQINSCTNVRGCCDGCGGGDTVAAYEYLTSVVGLAPDAYWPYIQGLTPEFECTSSGCTAPCATKLVDLVRDYVYIGPYAKVTDYAYSIAPCFDDCRHQSLSTLAAAVENMPVSVCLNAANWDDYVGGVMTVETCGGYAYDDLDHCVQLVGYNNATDSAYWIVRNSWSTDWGEDGYIRLAFDANTCGLANEPTVAVVEVGGP